MSAEFPSPRLKTSLLSLLAVAGSMLAGAGAVSAQNYPARSVRVIVPYAAGGPTDVIARVVAQKLSQRWGEQVYVENAPGAGGNTGIANAARAKPDGYTILVVSTGFIADSIS